MTSIPPIGSMVAPTIAATVAATIASCVHRIMQFIVGVRYRQLFRYSSHIFREISRPAVAAHWRNSPVN